MVIFAGSFDDRPHGSAAARGDDHEGREHEREAHEDLQA
jgi:hypothetical protein